MATVWPGFWNLPEAPPMFTCLHCKFTVPLDDVFIDYGGGRCTCIRCQHHVTGTQQPMPKELRRSVEQTLRETEG